MERSVSTTDRVRAEGKFFRVGHLRFQVKGVSYGPFAPDAHPDGFASVDDTRRDFQSIAGLGANVVRVYHVPPAWFVDLALEHGLRVFVDVPWSKHLCFAGDRKLEREARGRVTEATTLFRGHPGVFALSVVNEIPADIARWSGTRRTAEFINELADCVKSADPDRLVTFTNYPPTEYLESRVCDFVCFNVYLHDPGKFDRYLSRLQMRAGARPLVLGEFGIDSLREGEAAQCEFLNWQIELACRRGLAGTVVFSYTDDWFRGGLQVEDWSFGLTRRDRTPKPSFETVRQAYARAPWFPLKYAPRVSVVVASYNGAATLQPCLDSLARLNYPDYEVILVNDGSTDNTREIAARHPSVFTVHQTNGGLSSARNAGITAATGEIVAFTDSDCRVDEDWLHYLIGDLLDFSVSGIGGHNLLPPDDSSVAAAVMASPGGPAHVMLTDREAEHIPGCNMAFFKSALEGIGGFDPVFHSAGDDVDICWRLQQNGHTIGFSSGGFVWHHRRSTVDAYLRQQGGYGKADALLARKHPNYFNSLGGGLWRGRIYSTNRTGIFLQTPLVYHGVFGSGFFQGIYASPASFPLMFCTSIEFYALVAAPVAAGTWVFRLPWLLAVLPLLLPIAVCVTAAAQAEIPQPQRRWWSRALVALLFMLQPIERGLARYRCRISAPFRRHVAGGRPAELASLPAASGGGVELVFWSAKGVDRFQLLTAFIERFRALDWQIKSDSGWANHDVEVSGFRWARVRLITAVEILDQGATNFRWRLETRWTLEAIAYFWLTVGLNLLLIGFLAPLEPWIWMILLTLPLVGAFLEFKQTQCLNYVAAGINDLSKAYSMVPVAERRRSRSDRRPATRPGSKPGSVSEAIQIPTDLTASNVANPSIRQ